MDPDDNTKPILKDKMNLALLLYQDFLGVANSRGSWVVGRGYKVVGCRYQVVGLGCKVVGRGYQVVGRRSKVVGCWCKVGCPPSSVRFWGTILSSE